MSIRRAGFTLLFLAAVVVLTSCRGGSAEPDADSTATPTAPTFSNVDRAPHLDTGPYVDS